MLFSLSYQFCVQDTDSTICDLSLDPVSLVDNIDEPYRTLFQKLDSKSDTHNKQSPGE